MASTRPAKVRAAMQARPSQAHSRDGASTAAAQIRPPILVRSLIKAVTVYVDGALVTRRATIRLNPGTHVLEVRGLPAALDMSSLSVVALGASHPRLLKATMQPEDATSVALFKSLESQIEALQGQIERLDHAIAVLRADRRALRAMVDSVVGGEDACAEVEHPPSSQLATVDALCRRAEQINARLQQSFIERRELERELRRQQLHLEALPERQAPEGHVVRAQVEVTRPGDVIVEVSYMVPQASWAPKYELHFSESYGQSHLRVLYGAEIRQETGEDWRAVELTLSTGRPMLSNAFVDLDPWYIGVAPSGVRADGTAPVTGDRTPHTAVLPESVPSTQPAEVGSGESSYVTMISGIPGPEMIVPLSGPLTVAADGNVHDAVIQDISLEPDITYVVVPRRSFTVYRRLHLVNSSEWPFLVGKAELFQDEACIGTRLLDHTNPGETLEVFLGVEDRITVHSELVKRTEERKSLAHRQRMHYAYQVQIENTFPWPVRISLHDQIPVSRDPSVTVKLIATSPEPVESSSLGGLRWDLALDAHETRAVRFAFTVEAPQDCQIVGIG